MSDQTKTTTDQSQAQAAILRKVNLTSLATTLMVDDRSLSAKDAVRLAKEALEAGALALEAQTTPDQSRSDHQRVNRDADLRDGDREG